LRQRGDHFARRSKASIRGFGGVEGERGRGKLPGSEGRESPLTLECRSRPNGAAECSHWWSTGRCTDGAQPVVEIVC